MHETLSNYTKENFSWLLNGLLRFNHRFYISVYGTAHMKALSCLQLPDPVNSLHYTDTTAVPFKRLATTCAAPASQLPPKGKN